MLHPVLSGFPVGQNYMTLLVGYEPTTDIKSERSISVAAMIIKSNTI